MKVARESALGTCDYESNSPFLPLMGYEVESKSHFTSLSLGFLLLEKDTEAHYTERLWG